MRRKLVYTCMSLFICILVPLTHHYLGVIDSATDMLNALPSRPPQAPDNHFAIATLVLGGNPVAQRLIPMYIASLHMIASRLPSNIAQVCLWDNSVPIAAVDGWEVRPVSPINAPHNDVSNPYTRAGVYTKLHVWNLTEYSAVLYLDLDTLPLRSVWPLFDIYVPQMRSANKTIAMVVDGLGRSGNREFNAGVILIIPMFLEYSRLVRQIDTIPHDLVSAEQRYLNAFYKDSIFVLPSVYNVLNNDKTKASTYWDILRDHIVILHFVTKPWSFCQCFQDQVEDLCLLWQNLRNESRPGL